MQKVLCLAWLSAAWGLVMQQRLPEIVGSSLEVPVVRGGAGVALLEEGTSAVQTSESRVESLLNAEQTALMSQEQALEQIAAQQASLAQQQASLKEREAKVEAEIEQKLASGAASFSQVSTSSFSRAGLRDGLVAQVDKLKHALEKNFWSQLLSAVIYVVFVLCFGWFYGAYLTYEYPPLRKEPAVTRNAFSFGLADGCSCDPDSRIALTSFCCLPIRWADTASSPKVEFIKFWMGLFLFAILYSAVGISYGIAWFFVVALAVMNRQKIRDAYGMPKTWSALASDIGVWFCCAPCAAMQEAMEVEFVDPLGHTIPKMIKMVNPLEPKRYDQERFSANMSQNPSLKQKNTCC
mmetsp:Transcript_21128/g.38010  ORF Transcript_21128/g.38010 Transcript_21128/m.38010 type:complete len:351 (+) Transcript_21128:69-1121(+)|eukprot:CAMPEP_0197651082 /NCGR_PEP_ID=MMETSP1338-20131121/31340_1 /TAXON_ID=43686 ORGANISM="Pelagodinium beii, Strain RCC1491" /NCGR_SAMPLE_ID=MMETSP1338 /ASSEMBLY_ACC=CAM_ASM_000754 /LENGTH=350 /DNA_ID=CAMNT_0043225633 /DNA_START=69 /DNA_END=1121 /DNA_ORIENTATION=+